MPFHMMYFLAVWGPLEDSITDFSVHLHLPPSAMTFLAGVCNQRVKILSPHLPRRIEENNFSQHSVSHPRLTQV
jgi:hypothetical protein